MRIGIIGAGMIGGATAQLLARAGHDIWLSNSRGPESLVEQAQKLGSNVQPSTVEEAATAGDIVIAAIPFGKYETLPAQTLAGKIVIDTMNYYPQRDGQMEFGGLTSTELVARHLSKSRVVKAFNTLYFATLLQEAQPQAPLEERLVVFLAGDDAQATATVSKLIEEIGFAPIETGNLHEGSLRQQMGAPLISQPVKPAQARELLKQSKV